MLALQPDSPPHPLNAYIVPLEDVELLEEIERREDEEDLRAIRECEEAKTRGNLELVPLVEPRHRLGL